jgi:hypothetical protein
MDKKTPLLTMFSGGKKRFCVNAIRNKCNLDTFNASKAMMSN